MTGLAQSLSYFIIDGYLVHIFVDADILDDEPDAYVLGCADFEVEPSFLAIVMVVIVTIVIIVGIIAVIVGGMLFGIRYCFKPVLSYYHVDTCSSVTWRISPILPLSKSESMYIFLPLSRVNSYLFLRGLYSSCVCACVCGCDCIIVLFFVLDCYCIVKGAVFCLYIL